MVKCKICFKVVYFFTGSDSNESRRLHQQTERQTETQIYRPGTKRQKEEEERKKGKKTGSRYSVMPADKLLRQLKNGSRMIQKKKSTENQSVNNIRGKYIWLLVIRLFHSFIS